ncbi:MAG: UDP-glucose/GDP-mannose dehydrogenase family protein, partial [Dehalococcoidia bacterium]
DDSCVVDALDRLPGSKTVVLKSTVLPGMTDELQARYPQHRILFNPEFLREATAYRDLVRPDRQIVGCTRASSAAAAGVMAILPRAPFERICPAREAEMAKYVANAFLAIKVSYANEVFDLCERIGVAYDGVRDIVAADRRIGGSHLDVNDGGYRGYAGKCLPKDTRSLLELAASAGVHMDVLRSADRTNMRLRTPARPHRRAAEAGDDDAADTPARREQAA